MCRHLPTDVTFARSSDDLIVQARCARCGAHLKCHIEYDDWAVVAATHARRSASLPKEKNPYAWEEAIREIDELLDLLDELPEAAEDFVDSVREQADDMQSWIAGHEHVTEAQQTTIANWAAGASRWLEH